MTEAPRVTVTTAGGVATVTLSRPDKLNALDPAMFAAILDAQVRVGGEPAVRAVVLTGEGRGFCAGLDLALMASGGSGIDLDTPVVGPANAVQAIGWGWRALAVPVIAAVHGPCFGGGLQLLAGADIAFATPDARFSIMELKWGLVPDMAGFALWRGRVRDDHLRELVYTHREFGGREAQAMGFVTNLADDPLAAATALAEEIAGRNPHAIRAAKRIANATPDQDATEILRTEAEEQKAILRSPNQMEAVIAAMAKRAPVFADPDA